MHIKTEGSYKTQPNSDFLRKIALFLSDAEIVAVLFVKMIQNGDLTPKLHKKVIDSLELIMKIK